MTKLYEVGEFYVEPGDVDGRRVFTVIHAPTGVVCAASPVPSAAVSGAYMLNEQLKATLKNPAAEYERIAARDGALSTSGFGFAD